MNVSQAIGIFLNYHRVNSKKTTLRNHEFVLARFSHHFGEREAESISSDEILTFLTKLTEGRNQSTKRLRYALLSAFFNFVKTTINPELQNPCGTPMLRKLFRVSRPTRWKILDKEVVDEVIFRTVKARNRLMLELMARGGMRVGEVLKLTPKDIEDRKLLLADPKSGKEREVVYIPQKVADRLKAYITDRGVGPDQRIFSITYQAARSVMKKAGNVVGIHLRAHDLRRHAATYASRSGTPLEIVSKVILRHANLSTTQRYLGKVTDAEAMRWIENLYG